MSYLFNVGDVTVWSPSLNVGRIYVETVEAMDPRIGVSTGLIADASDMYVLHPQQFPVFIYELGFGGSSKHPVYASLVRGFVAVGLVMMERGGIGQDVVGLADKYRAEVALMRTSMPR